MKYSIKHPLERNNVRNKKKLGALPCDFTPSFKVLIDPLKRNASAKSKMKENQRRNCENCGF